MRIIAGRLRRRVLRAPRGTLTRPTSDRTRESIFNLLASRLDLDGAVVLDLFAGTGALGLEAVSRGAAAVTFVELNGHVLKYTRQNADKWKGDGIQKQDQANFKVVQTVGEGESCHTAQERFLDLLQRSRHRCR